VNLRFEIEFNKNGIQLDNFKEEWANKHPNPTTKSYWCNLYYNSTHIEQFILVSVDGGRALLPLPNGRDDLFVKPLYYKVAQIYDDSFGSLDKYMIRSGLKILE
jgi:hypothetical protein